MPKSISSSPSRDGSLLWNGRGGGGVRVVGGMLRGSLDSPYAEYDGGGEP